LILLAIYLVGADANKGYNITIGKGLLLLQNDADFCRLAVPVGRPVVASLIYRIYTLAFFTNQY
jgi:hypothetical protein